MKKLSNLICRTLAIVSLALGALSLPSVASAQSQLTGTVGKIHFYTRANTTPWAFRVYLTAPVLMCAGSSYTWAYVALGQTGYDDLTAQLRLSKLAQLPVTITTDLVNGACQITNVLMD